MSRAALPLADPQTGPAWNLAWLTPARCRLILATVVAFGFLSHLYYLHYGIPIGLTGDEAQYWVWSRQLDINYYSKGPLVAWIIRLSTEIFGHTMPAVRYPALVLGVGSTLCLYWLIRRLTGSHRTALGGVLLTHIVPMFIAGSVLMTIDPPFYFCWALASCLLVKALWDQTRWAWVAAGLVVAAGTLAKYAMLIWLVGALALVVRENRAALRSWRLWALAGLGLLGLAPALIWNARHDWVTLKHVSRQTGATAGGFDPLGPLEMLAGQFGALSPGIFILAVAGTIWACRPSGMPDRRAARLLLWVGLPIWAAVLLASFRVKPQVNWPAPAYFTLLALAAIFLADRLADRRRWRRWRWVFWPTVIPGVALAPLIHDLAWTYPAAARFGIDPRQFDPAARFRGFDELGAWVSQELGKLPPGSLVIADDYQTAALMEFYVAGQPRTYVAGSYFADPRKRSRMTQWDIWPDRRLDDPALLGRDAIYVDRFRQEDIVAAFESVEALPRREVLVHGVKVRTLGLWVCRGFKGMPRPESHEKH